MHSMGQAPSCAQQPDQQPEQPDEDDEVPQSMLPEGEVPEPQLARLLAAVAAGRPGAVRKVLAAGAPVDGRHPTAPQRITPLGMAVEFQQLECARVLLEAGADPNLHAHEPADAPDANLLYRAALRGDTALARLLLDHGARVLCNSAGQSAVHHAAQQGTPPSWG